MMDGLIRLAEMQHRREPGDLPVAEPQPERPPLELVLWQDLGGTGSRDYLVKHLLDRAALSVVYGESNSGKTFFALDLAAHVALGWRWNDLKVRQGTVVYVAVEGGLGIEERLRAFELHHEAEPKDVPLALIKSPINLWRRGADTDRLIAAVQALNEALPEPVELIVIDTLARALAGGDENSPEDMGALIANCDRIRQATGAHILLIHHCGKDASKGARGHNSLRCAVDTEIEVVKTETGIATATVRKQRDRASGQVFPFSLRSVEIGRDEDGEAITSCAVEPSDAPQKAAGKLTGKSRLALEKLHDCICDRGISAPASKHIPSQVKVITEDQWREYLLCAGVLNKDGNPREEFRRVKARLQEAGRIGIWDGYVWAV